MSPTKRRWRIEDPFAIQKGVANGTASGDASIEIAGLDWGGEGPIALLNHANGFCAATWGLVAGKLCGRFRVVGIDARGHGDSDTRPAPEGFRWDYLVSDLSQVARQLMEETGEPDIALGVGSSLGGIITAGAESEHPGLFRRIAMFDPPLHLEEPLVSKLHLELGPQSERPRIAEQAKNRSAVWPSRDTARQAWRDKPIFSNWQPGAFELYLQEGFRDLADGSVELKCNPLVEATIFETTGSLNTFDIAPQISPPVLLVRAGRGMFLPPVFEHLAGLFPNCTYRVADAGHLLPMEAPDLVTALLEEFAPERIQGVQS